MVKFNINEDILIQITEEGWKYLKESVGSEYIKYCILPYQVEIGDEIWYKIQAHKVFHLLPINYGNYTLINTNILIDEGSLDKHLP